MKIKLKAAILTLFLTLTLSEFALAQKVIVGTLDVQGNKTTDKSLIISVSGLQEGVLADFETLQNAIRSVYGLHLFSDVQILGQEAAENVNLTIQVTEYPRIRQVKIEGNTKVKQDNIKEALTIKQGELASPGQVQNGLNQILDLYHKKGYPLAEVETNPIPNSTGELTLEYKIKEGPKVKLKEVFISGNKTFTQSKLKGELKLKIDNFEEKFQEAKQNLIDYYKDNGYLDFAIVSDSVWYSPDKTNMFVWLKLNEGEQFKFGKVSLEGEKLFSEQALLSRLKFKPGEIYSQKKLEESERDMEAMYYDQGHIYVQLTDQLKTDGQAVNISLSLNEGVAAHVALIDIEGNTKTKEKVIRRELFLKPGDLFQRSLLERSLRNVMVLNYFSNVTPNYEALPNGDVDLTLKVEEKPTGQVSFGAGYSELDKVVGTIGLGIPNLFGNGQSADLNWDFGKTKNSIQISFTDPWFRDTPTTVGFDLYSLDQNYYDYYTEKRQGLGLRGGKRISWPDNYSKIMGRYRIERVTYHDISPGYVTLLSKKNERAMTSAMDYTFLRDSRNLAQFATKGSVLSFNSELGGGFLGGDWNYVRETLELRKYIPLFWKLSLMTKAKLGLIDSWKKNLEDNIPYNERFFPGGIDPDGMIRGYPDSKVGPQSVVTDSLGNHYTVYDGGRSVLVYNLELQIPIVEQQIYVILFSDAGNAWLSGKEMQPFDFSGSLNKSIGIGLRLVVPMLGMIGFDYGYGLDYPGPGKGRVHFQFGQQF